MTEKREMDTRLHYMNHTIVLHKDDARDKVIVACVKALLKYGNAPRTPKELSSLIGKHKMATIGGNTPNVTVSSRISQHFKRAASIERPPLFGKVTLEGKGKGRRIAYVVQQEGVPISRREDGQDKLGSDTDGDLESVAADGSTPPAPVSKDSSGSVSESNSFIELLESLDADTPAASTASPPRKRSAPLSATDIPPSPTKRVRRESESSESLLPPKEQRRLLLSPIRYDPDSLDLEVDEPLGLAFHQDPEDLSMSELDLLLEDGWSGVPSGTRMKHESSQKSMDDADIILTNKRANDDLLQPEPFLRDKRRRISIVRSTSFPGAFGVGATMRQSNGFADFTVTSSRTAMLESDVAPSLTISTSSLPPSMSINTPNPPAATPTITSYRVSGDTLSLYSLTTPNARLSRIRAAPKLDIPFTEIVVDGAGKCIERRRTTKRSIHLDGWIRWEEGGLGSQSPSAPTLNAAGGSQLWRTYTRDLLSHVHHPRGRPDESVLFSYVEMGKSETSRKESYRMVFLKGSDVDAEGLVPQEVAGVWIPPHEAKNLATRLNQDIDSLLSLPVQPSPVTEDHASPTPLDIKIEPGPDALLMPTSSELIQPDKVEKKKLKRERAEDTAEHAAWEGESEFLDWDDGELETAPSGISLEIDTASSSTESMSANTSVAGDGDVELPVNLDLNRIEMVPPVEPVPGGKVYLTSIEGVVCYVTWIGGSDSPTSQTPPVSISSVPGAPRPTPPYTPLLRRQDSNFVNATLLLHAGGLVTDHERSIVLSLERVRRRCRKKNSALFGTWIPLSRARALCRTVCLERDLEGFLWQDVGRCFKGVEDNVLASAARQLQEMNNGGATTTLPPNLAALAASKAAMLGLTSLPPGVASNLASMPTITTTPQRGRGRGRPPVRQWGVGNIGRVSRAFLGSGFVGRTPSTTSTTTPTFPAKTTTGPGIAVPTPNATAGSNLSGLSMGGFNAATFASVVAAINSGTLNLGTLGVSGLTGASGIGTTATGTTGSSSAPNSTGMNSVNAAFLTALAGLMRGQGWGVGTSSTATSTVSATSSLASAAIASQAPLSSLLSSMNLPSLTATSIPSVAAAATGVSGATPLSITTQPSLSISSLPTTSTQSPIVARALASVQQRPSPTPTSASSSFRPKSAGGNSTTGGLNGLLSLVPSPVPLVAIDAEEEVSEESLRRAARQAGAGIGIALVNGTAGTVPQAPVFAGIPTTESGPSSPQEAESSRGRIASSQPKKPNPSGSGSKRSSAIEIPDAEIDEFFTDSDAEPATRARSPNSDSEDEEDVTYVSSTSGTESDSPAGHSGKGKVQHRGRNSSAGAQKLLGRRGLGKGKGKGRGKGLGVGTDSPTGGDEEEDVSDDDVSVASGDEAESE
ncbi:hypothetical protein HDU85_003742 [Gaertneriomyces sp. JEL0708]|nr:hypothetical protein HDU85_003742 [Gaertneriomyces sp. JEL0708]